MNKAFILDVMNTTISCGVLENIINRGPYCISTKKADNWVRNPQTPVKQSVKVNMTSKKFYI